MGSANYIAESMLAILCGASLHIGIFSILYSLLAKAAIEKLSFALCALLLLAILLTGIANVNLSYWISFCYFVGFAIASITISNQNTLSNTPQVLHTKKMRAASRRSEELFSVLLTFQSLVLLSVFYIPVNSTREVAVALLFLFICVSSLSIMSRFLCRPSRLACFTSLLFAFGLVLASLIPFGKVLDGSNTIATSTKLSLCAGMSIFFWYYSCAISRLTAHELLLTMPTGMYPFLSIKSYLARAGVKKPNALLAWGCDIAARLVLGLHGFFKIFTVGALVYLLCFFPWLILWQNPEQVTWETAMIISSMALFLHAMLIAGVIVCVLTSYTLRLCSQFLSKASYFSTIQEDHRPPVLFLRPFANDQGKLRPAPLYERIWSGKMAVPALDHLLVERFSHFGPIVALGAPGEHTAPYGASRLYIDKDHDWISEVIRLAEKALAVVVICENTDSIIEEIHQLAERRLLHKVLLLASPERSDRGLESLTATEQLVAHAAEQVVISYYQVGDTSRTFVCNTICSEDYVVCCNAFLTELLSPEILVRAYDRIVTI